MIGYYEDPVVDLDGDCDIEGSFSLFFFAVSSFGDSLIF